MLIFFSGCMDESSGLSAEDGNTSKISVAVSIPPQKEFAESVGGEKVNVFVMVPPGSNPHTYELTPGQLRNVADADMYAMVGSGIEFELAWMDKIKGVNQGMLITDCSKGVSLIKNGGDGSTYGDPHIWVSLKNAKIMSENICEGLSNLRPEYRDYFYKNLQDYEDKLDALDVMIKNELSCEKNRTIMVYHPAWSYFARDYSLNIVSVEESGKEPSPADLAGLIRHAEENNVKVIFASPEYSTKSAEVIAKAIGGEVVLIDPLSGNYTQNMESVAKAFASEY